MRRIISFLPFVALVILGTLSCDNEKESVKEEEKQRVPQVVTLSADKDTFMVVTLFGQVSGLDDVAPDFECGIEYSIDESFSDGHSTRKKVDKKYTEDSYSITVSDIQSGEKYYYRAYCVNQRQIYYGEVKTFTFEWTVEESKVVDLGLSVKWASCNVGASKPEDYGDYYTWGETETKSTYSLSNYKHCNGSDFMTKYSTNSIYGTVDNKTTLDPEDDAAYVIWGGDWRMPTKTEFDELCDGDNCTWTWTTRNGVNGYLVTSKKSGYEGASIFLPAAGTRSDTYLYDDGYCGIYWSSSLNTDAPANAWYLSCDSDNKGMDYCRRYDGFSIRPVCP